MKIVNRIGTYESLHDTTNKIKCAHSVDSDQTGHLPSLI